MEGTQMQEHDSREYKREKQEHKRTTLQEREVHRYYQPWLDAHGSSLNVASHVESIAQHDLHGQGYRPRSSHDKALIAFAQLAVLRLSVKRAMVSLIDSTNQYILAEATAKSFMTKSDDTSDTSYRTPEDVWLGTTILNRPDAVCEHCFTGNTTGRNVDGRTWTAKGLIVNDCREDVRFKWRSYVKQEPGVRFYAGVPIISRGGYMIGAYAVSDEKPRDGLTAEELKFMHEMSQAVMDHLEWARDRVDRFKGDRIVRGMASFIEGCSTLSGPREHNSTSPDSKAARARVENDVPFPGGAQSPGGAQRPPMKRRVSGTKPDKMSRMFERATTILRESTLADGVVMFGATPGVNGRSSNMKVMDMAMAGTSNGSSEDANQPSPGSDAGHSTASASDSDQSPALRPCKILALALADDRAQEDIEQKSALSTSTLEQYNKLFPKGRTFYFTDQGSGCSSGDESGLSERDDRPTTRRRKMDHKELLKKIPGAKSVTFLPLYDYAEEKLVAGCFLWTSVTGRMMNLDEDLSHLHAFGNSVMSEAARIHAQKNEAAKTTFIASMSHELRSPLHGILGATEFLKDTATDTYQAGLITSIVTCGRTLLDTLNHVLDYSKINKLGRAQMRRHAKQNRLVALSSDSSFESLSMTAEVELDVLFEEVVEAITAGHAFKKNGLLASPGASALSKRSHTPADEKVGNVSVLLDITPRRNWTVKTQPGALRRIIMNLLGNALKYTSSGFVAVTLRGEQSQGNGRLNALVQVVDSGKGMSEDFQTNRLFVPFSQEDSFQPGTGLGLSIVKQIADSLRAGVEVKSQENVGTEVDVRMSLALARSEHEAPLTTEDEIGAAVSLTRGRSLALIEPDIHDRTAKSDDRSVARFKGTLSDICKGWFELDITTATSVTATEADLVFYTEPPSLEYIVQHHSAGPLTGGPRSVIIACLSAEEAVGVTHRQSKALAELGWAVEVLPQPCGPRKLARLFERCLRPREVCLAQQPDRASIAGGVSQITQAAEEVAAAGNTHDNDNTPHAAERPTTLAAPIPERPVTVAQNRSSSSSVGISGVSAFSSTGTSPASLSSAISYPSPPPLNPETPPLDGMAARASRIPNDPSRSPIHVLLVDDNKINLQLLVMFMKKHGYSYETAENGQEALDKYKESCLPGPNTEASPQNPTGQPLRKFDYVLMDISMPVMNGMDSTRFIRDFERENQLKRTTVIALTGLASAQAQREAEACGIDVFLPKPVRFGELKKLLVPPS